MCGTYVCISKPSQWFLCVVSILRRCFYLSASRYQSRTICMYVPLSSLPCFRGADKPTRPSSTNLRSNQRNFEVLVIDCQDSYELLLTGDRCPKIKVTKLQGNGSGINYGLWEKGSAKQTLRSCADTDLIVTLSPTTADKMGSDLS